MAVGAEDGPVGVRHAVDDRHEEVVNLVGRRVADGVGQIDRRGAGVDHRLDDPAQKVQIAARGVFRRELRRRRCSVRACVTAATACSRHCSRVMFSLRAR